MRRELRLRRKADFDAVFKGGRAWHNELLVVRTLANDLSHYRCGIVTTKKLGGAVVRNRVKRRLREAVRVLPLKPGWDIVVSTKIKAASADFHALNRAVTELLTKADVLGEAATA